MKDKEEYMDAKIINVERNEANGERGDTVIEFSGTIVIAGETYSSFDKELQELIDHYAI